MPTPSSSISVIVLTYNRATMLADCLETLRRQTRPPDEIVVVDNGSTDSTRQQLDALADGLPLRVVAGDPETGWAAARNLGVRVSTGDWTAFTDDDCLPLPDWLERAEALFAELDAVGGAVFPADPLPWPWWWHPRMSWAAGLSDPDAEEDSPYKEPVYPTTSNWLARRSVLLAEPFQEIESAQLAAVNGDGKKNLYLGGREDAELWRRLRRAGYRCRFDPRLRVAHRVGPERLRPGAILRRAHHDGMSLQRREPCRAYLPEAIWEALSAPLSFMFDIWRGPRAPWREAAWRAVWTARQCGQCRQTIRALGWRKGTRLLATLAARTIADRELGIAKRLARKISISLTRLARARARRGASRIVREDSILIAAAGYVGDMLLLHPFITALKVARPEVNITLLTNAVGEQFYRHDPAVVRLLVLGRSRAMPGEDAATIRHVIKKHKVDLTLVPYFYKVDPSALFSNRRARVATFAQQVGFPRQWWYDRADVRIEKPSGRPESENLFSLFAEAGLRQKHPPATPLAFLAEELESVVPWMRDRKLRENAFIIVAPGGGQTKKRWPADRWAKIVAYLAVEREQSVVLFGSPDEEPLCREILRLSGCTATLFVGGNLRHAAILIGHARLMVCCDSGAKHLAVTMETASLALFGPTDEGQWGAARDATLHRAIRGCALNLTDEERAELPENHQMLCLPTSSAIAALEDILKDESLSPKRF